MTTASAIRHPLWAALRHRDGPATVPELARAIGAPDSTIAWRLSRWTKAGLLEAIKPANEAGEARTTYLMPKSSRIHTAPPSLNAQLRPTIKRGGRAAMWRAMRVLKSFDLVQLVMTAEVSHDSAKTYVSALLRAGILRRDVRGHSATGQRSIYTLNGSFGPKPATVGQRKINGRTITIVTDPNTASTREISALPPCAPLF
jgi:hypothetical protein